VSRRHANPPSLELLLTMIQVAAADPAMWGEHEVASAPVEPVVYGPPRPVMGSPYAADDRTAVVPTTPERPDGTGVSEAAEHGDMRPVPSSR